MVLHHVQDIAWIQVHTGKWVQSGHQSNGLSGEMGIAYEPEGNIPCKSNCLQGNQSIWSPFSWCTWNNWFPLWALPSLRGCGGICHVGWAIAPLVSAYILVKRSKYCSSAHTFNDGGDSSRSKSMALSPSSSKSSSTAWSGCSSSVSSDGCLDAFAALWSDWAPPAIFDVDALVVLGSLPEWNGTFFSIVRIPLRVFRVSVTSSMTSPRGTVNVDFGDIYNERWSVNRCSGCEVGEWTGSNAQWVLVMCVSIFLVFIYAFSEVIPACNIPSNMRLQYFTNTYQTVLYLKQNTIDCNTGLTVARLHASLISLFITPIIRHIRWRWSRRLTLCLPMCGSDLRVMFLTEFPQHEDEIIDLNLKALRLRQGTIIWTWVIICAWVILSQVWYGMDHGNQCIYIPCDPEMPGLGLTQMRDWLFQYQNRSRTYLLHQMIWYQMMNCEAVQRAWGTCLGRAASSEMYAMC